jgi:hypothetical protein
MGVSLAKPGCEASGTDQQEVADPIESIIPPIHVASTGPSGMENELGRRGSRISMYSNIINIDRIVSFELAVTVSVHKALHPGGGKRFK